MFLGFFFMAEMDSSPDFASKSREKTRPLSELQSEKFQKGVFLAVIQPSKLATKFFFGSDR